MSKKAPSRLSGGRSHQKVVWRSSPSDSRAQLSSASGLSLRFSIDLERGKAKDAPLTDIQRLTVIAGLRFSEEAVHGNIYKLLTQT
jgi:hypothetical protein